MDDGRTEPMGEADDLRQLPDYYPGNEVAHVDGSTEPFAQQHRCHLET
jgi:hypothetical protein